LFSLSAFLNYAFSSRKYFQHPDINFFANKAYFYSLFVLKVLLNAQLTSPLIVFLSLIVLFMQQIILIINYLLLWFVVN